MRRSVWTATHLQAKSGTKGKETAEATEGKEPGKVAAGRQKSEQRSGQQHEKVLAGGGQKLENGPELNSSTL
jgi:hypothetical protein